VPGGTGYKITCFTASNVLTTYRVAAPATNRSFVSRLLGAANVLRVIATNLNTPANVYLSTTNFLTVNFIQVPAVTNLSAAALATNRIALAWDDVSGETGYLITTNSPNTAFRTASLGSGTTVWTDAHDNKGRTRTYYIAGTNSYGISAWDSATVSVETTPPSVVLPILPAASNVTNDGSPSFLWRSSTDLSGISGYQVRIGSTVYDAGSATNWTYPSVWVDGPSNWSVRAIDTFGNPSAWSTNRSLTVDTGGPAVVSLAMPFDGSVLASTTATLSWGATSDLYSSVSGYIAERDDNPAFSSPVVVVTNGLAWPVAGLVNAATNWWRVRAFDSRANTNAWSVVRIFSVDTNQIKPVIVSPLNGVIRPTNSVSVAWKSESSKGAVRYGLVLRTTNGATVSSNSSIVLTNAVVGPLTDGVYAVQVQASNSIAGRWQLWSDPVAFRIDTTGPAAPVLVGPAQNLVQASGNVLFLWRKTADPSGVTNYEFELAGAASLTTNLGTLTNLGATLADGTYQWRVRAVDAWGHAGSWSAQRTLTVGATPAQDAKAVKAGPNPLKAGDHLHFAGLPANFKIRFYTVTGRFVAEITGTTVDGTFDWDTMVGGSELGSGVYLVRVENADDPKDYRVLKIAAVR
jgi:hypothetical protein